MQKDLNTVISYDSYACNACPGTIVCLQSKHRNLTPQLPQGLEIDI